MMFLVRSTCSDGAKFDERGGGGTNTSTSPQVTVPYGRHNRSAASHLGMEFVGNVGVRLIKLFASLASFRHSTVSFPLVRAHTHTRESVLRKMYLVPYRKQHWELSQTTRAGRM